MQKFIVPRKRGRPILCWICSSEVDPNCLENNCMSRSLAKMYEAGVMPEHPPALRPALGPALRFHDWWKRARLVSAGITTCGRSNFCCNSWTCIFYWFGGPLRLKRWIQWWPLLWATVKMFSKSEHKKNLSSSTVIFSFFSQSGNFWRKNVLKFEVGAPTAPLLPDPGCMNRS